MPIKGISDQIRLPRLGKIRLGIMVENGREPYPQPVDYFVCPEPVQRVFGEKPRELPVMFPSEDDEKWASQFYRCYSRSRGLVCKGDGQKASALVDKYTGHLAHKYSHRTEIKEISCNPEHCPAYGNGRCRRVINLQFLLPDVPGLGIWQLDSSSYHSISNVNSGIRLVKSLCGHIAMIPLVLRVISQRAHPNGVGKTVFVLSLDMAGTLAGLMQTGQQRSRKVSLPESDEEAPDDLFPGEILEELSSCHVMADDPAYKSISLNDNNNSRDNISINKSLSLSLSRENRTCQQQEKEVSPCGSSSKKDKAYRHPSTSQALKASPNTGQAAGLNSASEEAAPVASGDCRGAGDTRSASLRRGRSKAGNLGRNR